MGIEPLSQFEEKKIRRIEVKYANYYTIETNTK